MRRLHLTLPYQEQIRDLMFYIEAREKVEKDAEMQEGQVVVGESSVPQTPAARLEALRKKLRSKRTAKG